MAGKAVINKYYILLTDLLVIIPESIVFFLYLCQFLFQTIVFFGKGRLAF